MTCGRCGAPYWSSYVLPWHGVVPPPMTPSCGCHGEDRLVEEIVTHPTFQRRILELSDELASKIARRIRPDEDLP